MNDNWLNIREFSGIDQSLTELDTPVHASPDTQNMRTNGGILSTAGGFTPYIEGALPGRIFSLMVYRKRGSNNATSLLASTANGLYYVDNLGQWQQIAGCPGGIYDAVNYGYNDEDVLYMANRRSPILCWDGMQMGSTPVTEFSAGTICLSNERLWASGDAEQPETVWYSNEFSPKQWTGTGAGFIGVPSWDASNILAMRNYYNEVVVFKDRYIYRIYGTYPGEFGVSRIHGVDGPCSMRAITSYKDKVYFFNERGICFYDGLRARPLGDNKLRHLLKNVTRSSLALSCAACVDGKLYFSISEKGAVYNNVVVEYDVDKKEYMIRRGIEASSFLELDNKLLFGSGDGYVYEYDAGRTYATQPMQAHWKTPRMDLGAKHVKKYSTTMYTHVSGQGVMKVEAKFGGRTKSKEITLSDEMRPVRFRLRNKGRTVQFTFSNVDGSYFDMHSPEISVEADED